MTTVHGDRVATPSHVSTRNACKLCSPLGACFVFRGIENTVPFLHGSQGCATYIRRYMIGHFREPVDIASSSFGEASAVFGGRANLTEGLRNVIRQYQPEMVGIATTCLAETIGDDVRLYLRELTERLRSEGVGLPALVPVSTPSYEGSHMSGFRAALTAVVETIAAGGTPTGAVNVIGGLVSPADLRELKRVLASFALDIVLLPDYSDTLDGGSWEDFQRIPLGGTPLAALRSMGRSRATVQLGCSEGSKHDAGAVLQARFGVQHHALPVPIGVQLMDRFVALLERLSGRPMPPALVAERSRVLDAYVDAHKLVFERRVVVYGDEDLVVGLTAFLCEIGALPVICATGDRTGHLRQRLERVCEPLPSELKVMESADFVAIEKVAHQRQAQLLLGNSKGYPVARRLGIPHVRVGFPVHDRFGGARLLHLGYAGAQQLFDRLVNTLLEAQQTASPVGYMFM